ncbi:uncharacterized protein LOC133850667 isoform X1 [Drosophila sulfurigaster albostrigata]|uniref:uncharacterized protein LOC133850667 isoform X1 n=1 Tax=Drosophila sulfurigaster albostrigata TaxID=89887 RepID=UPI002D219264|nr:uncharacterized protein LOC133850667 isoform X1 [Drosophila sulfurigaster albostrigata]XP_062142795.1 uncharacterized protein LOC133850667 isoform X1 [Drosophila sulfurigaster albostrigata]
MYAAAGGASLASRQARQRQRQQKKNQQLQAKLHPPKAAGAGAGLGAADHGGASTPTRSQSRQFHQLPTNYLRAPQPQGRKLSATYTQSRSLLPIEEAGDTQSVLQLRMHSHTHGPHAHGHGHAHMGGHGHSHLHHSHLHGGGAVAGPPQTPYQQFASSHGRVSPKLVHRHSGSSSSAGFHPAATSQLHKSATATLPLVSQMEPTPPTTPALPSAAVGVKTTAMSLEAGATPEPESTLGMGMGMAMASTSAAAAAAAAEAVAEAEAADLQLAGAAAMFAAHHDAIIVTPATPMASPGHVAAIKLRRGDHDQDHDDDVLHDAAERQPLTAATDAYDEDEAMQPPAGPLERKCSVYRMRRSDAFEQGDSGGGGGVTGGLKRQLRELQFQQTQYEPLVSDEPQLLFKGLGNGRKWQLCAYCEEGICVCEHIECAQGRAAWLERGRRCSVQEQQQQQATCHRRWVKRNRIQDASLGGSSDDEDFLGVLRGPSTFANAFLYVGLGTVALGLVIAFVGTGEKGFKTVELRLIGPSLIGLGLICCILRILFCICPSHCISSSKKTRKKNGNKIDADHTTSLLRNESKRVSIARGPAVQPKYPIAHKRSQSKMLNEGMEALRQIATTSLFMQNEQKTAINRVVPIINEPESMDHMGADAPLEMKKLQTALNMCEMSDEEQEIVQQQQLQLAKRTATTTTAVTSSTTKATAPTESTAAATATKATTTLSTVDEKPNSKLVRQRVALQQQRQLQQQQRQQQQQHQQLQEQPEQSQSLSSSSTVRDSLDGIVVVEETSLMDTEIVPPTTTSTATSTSTSTAPMSMPMALPSSCSTGAIPRLKSNTAAFSTPAQRPGISTGATPKTTTTPTTNNNTRLTSSQSHPTSYDLPPAQPHTYSAAATVRGPLGMTLTGSSSVYAMPASRLSGLTATSSASPTSLSTTTTISLLPLPAPPTSSIAGTAMASIPGQVLEPTGIATTSLSILQPLTAAKAATGATGMTGMTSAMTMQRPATASSASTSASLFGMEHKSQPSSASATMGGRGSSLLPPPQPSASKFEPELVLSPAKLGQ